MLPNTRNLSRVDILIEIEEVFSQIIQVFSLGHVIGIIFEISEPHFSILPVREPSRVPMAPILTVGLQRVNRETTLSEPSMR